MYVTLVYPVVTALLMKKLGNMTSRSGLSPPVVSFVSLFHLGRKFLLPECRQCLEMFRSVFRFYHFKQGQKLKVGSKKKHLRKATSFSSSILLSIVYFLPCFLLSSVYVNSLHGSDLRFSSSEKKSGGRGGESPKGKTNLITPNCAKGTACIEEAEFLQ